MLLFPPTSISLIMSFPLLFTVFIPAWAKIIAVIMVMIVFIPPEFLIPYSNDPIVLMPA